MPVRHALLAALAVLVAGMCVHLFIQVRATPAMAQATVASKDDSDTEDSERDDGAHTEVPGQRASRPPRAITTEPPPSESTPPPATSPTPAPSISGDASDGDKLTGVKLDAVMAEANKAYDKQDFDEARSIAQKVLKQHPANTRMLRIMTSSHCIENDIPEAQKYFNLLPAPDREQMKTRCARYGVTFSEPPAK